MSDRPPYRQIHPHHGGRPAVHAHDAAHRVASSPSRTPPIPSAAAAIKWPSGSGRPPAAHVVPREREEELPAAATLGGVTRPARDAWDGRGAAALSPPPLPPHLLLFHSRSHWPFPFGPPPPPPLPLPLMNLFRPSPPPPSCVVALPPPPPPLQLHGHAMTRWPPCRPRRVGLPMFLLLVPTALRV